MQVSIQNCNIIEALSEEFKGEYFYGLELIMDELDPIDDSLENNDPLFTDWFGLADNCI